MNENKEKREFAQQLEQIAETLTQAVKDNEGRAFILIGIDRKEGDDKEGSRQEDRPSEEGRSRQEDDGQEDRLEQGKCRRPPRQEGRLITRPAT